MNSQLATRNSQPATRNPQLATQFKTMLSHFPTIKTCLLTISLIPIAFLGMAQNACTYQLQLEDSFGDGWDDSFVAVQVNGVTTKYSLGDGDDDEAFQSITIAVTTGDSLSISYGTDGIPTFQNEISYRLLDAEQLEIIAEGPNPSEGLVWQEVIVCPTCPVLAMDAIRIENIRATSVDVFWQIEEGQQIQVVFGEQGIEQDQGNQQVLQGDSATLTNLRENTTYEVYLKRLCTDDEQSRSIGPFQFKTPFLSPPDTCFYTLRLLDFFGDGWNGSSISFTINDLTTDYTLVNGALEVVSIPALSNLPFEVNYNGGLFDEEISYILLDPEGNTILADGPDPRTGMVLNTTACPSCPVPLNPATDAFAETATLSWEEQRNVSSYVLEYGVEGFLLGEGLQNITESTTKPLTNLTENTTYDYYLYTTCGISDTSLQVVGPFTFKTLFKKDVGIQQITMPQTTCGLGVSEMIEIELKNFGANPQSLIPFQFSINRENGGVPIPTDGFFTGIISKDSSTFLQFETPADLMNTGIYEIAVWTELEGDGNANNDTAKVVITNIPTIQTYPYAENLEAGNGGWTVTSDSENPSWELGFLPSDSLPSISNGSTIWATNLEGPANASEMSYLLSPCMDFSAMSTDPLIAFRYFMDMPLISDARASLEMSIDGGRWQIVGLGSADFQWYNNDSQTAWIDNASLETWLYAEQTLEGAAGQEDIRLRFVFETTAADTVGFGLAVDDLHIFEPTAINAVARATSNSARIGCGNQEDQVSIIVRNSGMDTLRQLTLGYQVNNEMIALEQIDTILAPTSSFLYNFETPFSSELVQTYHLQAWVTTVGDNTPISDTTNFFFEALAPLPLPLIEDFNDEMVADGWQILQGSPSFTEPEEHNNSTVIVSDNMWFGNAISQFITAPYGPLNEGDSLTFLYRLADWPDATTPTDLTTDTLTIGISTDCGASFSPIYTIHQGNHLSSSDFTRVAIPLTDYVGQGVNFSFQMQWGAGDYWWDMDDIMVLSCPPSLALSAEIIDASGEIEADGGIQIFSTQGSGSYLYDWQEIDMTTDSIGGLSRGVYSVIVTDSLLGCVDSLTVEVGILSTSLDDASLIESLAIYPNPTAQSAQLNLALTIPKQVHIKVFNMIGQPISTFEYPIASSVTQDLALGTLPKGIYWIQVGVGEQLITRKLLKVQ